MANELDKWFSHCLPETGLRCNDIGEGKQWK